MRDRGLKNRDYKIFKGVIKNFDRNMERVAIDLFIR
jgi:hypothetical protein